MSEKRRATLAEAKAAWDAYPENDRSVRKVVKALADQGLDVAISTLQRWKDAGWAVGNIDAAAKAARASAKVSEKIGEHEGKAMTRLEVIAMEEAAMKVRRAELLADGNQTSRLQETAKRELYAAQILLAEQISRRAAVIVEVQPEIAAKILAVLTEATSSTTIIVPPDEAAANGEGAKVIEGRVLEPSPTAQAIEAFKARRRQEIAA